jgi:hypothetical protein
MMRRALEAKKVHSACDKNLDVREGKRIRKLLSASIADNVVSSTIKGLRLEAILL